ncbi:MAG: hypothetical protein CL424_07990 [Acidimicrobiaceae bacterium]|nr:hypothetical protein [Acidimicrobiaceae bacterium]
MRTFSSTRHVDPISGSHDRHVLIDDPLLPAAAHLTGPDAADVLRPAVEASGGELVSCRTSQVQYRPQSDLVVRYRCVIRRDGSDTSDTLLAATTIGGPHAGTVPIEAHTSDGTLLTVGVWRWPFDPVLGDLAAMVTPQTAATELQDVIGDRLSLEVVAYRPTERAVVRASGRRGEVYVKLVPPASVEHLARRHDVLSAAGLPVPRVVATGRGWVAMEALSGTTLRDRLKGGGPLPPAAALGDLIARLAEIDPVALHDVVGGGPTRSRLDDAPHHAAMLATVLPAERQRMTAIVERLTSATSPVNRAVATVHGDLHEGQVVVDDDGVIGLLDIDDVGPGDPLDDVAVLIAHLEFRALTSGDGRIEEYADHVSDTVGADRDAAAVERQVAAVLIGLATGPFRIQQPDWSATTARVLDLVEQHLDAAERCSVGVATG